MLAGALGTIPGIELDGFHLPLQPDPLFFHTLSNPTTAPYQGSAGVLGIDGTASAGLVFPAGAFPQLSGLTLYHAFASLDGSLDLRHVSNTVALALEP